MAGHIRINNDKEYDDWVRTVNPNAQVLYTHLKIKAAPQDGVYNDVQLKRGQIVKGRKQLQQELNMSEKTIRCAITKLVGLGKLISRSVGKEYTIYTIPYFNKHNGSRDNEDEIITDEIKGQGNIRVNHLKPIVYDAPIEDRGQQTGLGAKKRAKETIKKGQEKGQEKGQGKDCINTLESISSDVYDGNRGQEKGQEKGQENCDLGPRKGPLIYNTNKEEIKNINIIPSGIEKDFFKNFSKTAKEETWPEEAEKFMKADAFIRELRRKYPEWDKNKMLTTMKKWLVELNDQGGQKKLPGLIRHFRNTVNLVRDVSTDDEFLSKLDEIGVKKFYRGEAKKYTPVKSVAFIEVGENYEDAIMQQITDNKKKLTPVDSNDYLFELQGRQNKKR